MNIKRSIYEVVYRLYQHGIFHNKIHVKSIDETVQYLLQSNSSIVRFGDGEFKLISGKSIPNQQVSSDLSQRLLTIVDSNLDGLLIALPDIFDGLEQFIPESRQFWKEHLFFHRREYMKYCKNGLYANSFISRPYIMYENKKKQSGLFTTVSKLWDNTNIVFIEGNISHNAVDNDLFTNAQSIARIICPSENAYEKYDSILAECMKLPKDSLILITLGAAGKVLAYDLYNAGYRVLDIGSLDMEYGWYLEGATRKCRVPKHEIKTYEENIAAGYTEYLEQIIARIE